jgi:hypothetical protein
VQGEPHEGNGDWRERQPAADQPRGCAPTPRHACWNSTTTDAPTEARMPTPMLTHRHPSSGRPRTLPLRPCCYAAARSLQPPRSDECASS